MERNELLLPGVDVAIERGLELGPLNNPAVRKGAGDITYVDHCDAAGLRRKYAGEIDPASILEVDHVWAEGALRDAVAGRTFDYVVASHVIEHVPDMIGWLAGVAEVLRPGGRLCLAIPDKRYTFDILRPVSTVGEIIDAHLRRAKVPSPKQIYDNYTMVCHVDAGAAWRGEIDPAALRRIHPPGLARSFVDRAWAGEYLDCHCWVLTPSSFMDAWAQLLQENLVPFALATFHETRYGENEFFVGLQRR